MPHHYRRILARCVAVLALAATCAPAITRDWLRYNFDGRSQTQHARRTIRATTSGNWYQVAGVAPRSRMAPLSSST
jgi:hypothetical protein